jgi:hypothetical protein
MLDMKWVRDHADEVAAMLANRNYTFPLDKFVEPCLKQRLSRRGETRERKKSGSKKKPAKMLTISWKKCA